MKCFFGFHDWSIDCEKCSKCDKTRKHQHDWNGFKCKRCNQYNSILATNSIIKLVMSGQDLRVNEAIEAKADIYVTDANGGNAMLYASAKGNVNIVKMFLDAGVDVNRKYELKTNNTASLLGSAAYVDQCEVIEYLLKAGADVDIRDNKNDTPLLNAVINNKSRAVAILLKNGANPRAICRENITPYDLACSKGNHEIISLFNNYLSNSSGKEKESNVENMNYCSLHHNDLGMLLVFSTQDKRDLAFNLLNEFYQKSSSQCHLEKRISKDGYVSVNGQRRIYSGSHFIVLAAHDGDFWHSPEYEIMKINNCPEDADPLIRYNEILSFSEQE